MTNENQTPGWGRQNRPSHTWGQQVPIPNPGEQTVYQPNGDNGPTFVLTNGQPGQAPSPENNGEPPQKKGMAAKIISAVVVIAIGVAIGGVRYYLRHSDDEQTVASSRNSAALAAEKQDEEKTPWDVIEENVARQIAEPPPEGKVYDATGLYQFDLINGEVIQVATDQFGRPVTINKTGHAESGISEEQERAWTGRDGIECSVNPMQITIQRESNGGWWMMSDQGPWLPSTMSEPSGLGYAPTAGAMAVHYANGVLQSQAGRGVSDVFFPADAYRITDCAGDTVSGQVAFPVPNNGNPATQWYVLGFTTRYFISPKFTTGTEGIDELNARNYQALTGTVVNSLDGWQKFEWLPQQ